jgi:hypothetical protein
MTLHAGAFCVMNVAIMRTVSAIVSLLILAACSRQPAQPVGVYRLGTAEKTIVLDVRASGDYVLQIDGPDSMTDEIRGRWEDERNTEIDVTFHGIAWHGDQPEAGRTLWPVQFGSDGGFCVDVDELLCFTKDGKA